ncbi:MAG: M15 family metallopeptidase [Clostridiales bacterium]|nr:M15 family metallopeptidase [Clostridiales bacterium]
MKRFAGIFIIVLLLLAGCAPLPDGSEGSAAPPAEEIQLAARATAEARPAEALPETTPTPEPEPDPFAGQTKTYQAENAAFFYVELNEELKTRITGLSYPKNDKNTPVKYGDLRYLHILYVNFAGETCQGELMVHARLADEVLDIFYQLFVHEYPLASVRLVDDFGEAGDDNLSMEANNTSAFNYRQVTGSKKLSLHSYGAAIDINPVQNPYINGARVSPPSGAAYVDRTQRLTGMIDHDDLCYRLFASYGWSWGGDFSGDKDYQHFSKDIR